MKKFIAFALFLSLSLTFSFAQVEKALDAEQELAPTEGTTASGPVMSLETTEVDYGTILEDSDPFRFFKFTNTGDEPLVIKNAKGSCGCTVPTYPKEPILPGEVAEIKVRYATNRIGPFTKTVTLTTNEGVETRVLRIKGKVEKKAEEPEAVPAAAPSILGGNGGR